MKIEETPKTQHGPEAVSTEHLNEVHDHLDQRIYEITDLGDYKGIVQTLSKESLLDDAVEHVRSRYEATLESAAWMTEKDWEMLAVMDFYDEKTVRHCIETLRIAEDRIERFKAGDRKFSELIKHEGVPLQEFFRACLFHDIGKMVVPRSILNNTFFDKDFDTQLYDSIFHGGKKEFLTRIETATGHPFEGGDDEVSLHKYLRLHHVHTMRYVPVEKILSEADLLAARNRFPEVDFSNATLADLIQIHEEGSEKILTDCGFVVAASIAGKHHNYHKTRLRFPVSTEVLSVSIALEEILALSDMKQALSSKRSYKDALCTPLVLRDLILEATQHDISPVTTSLWVKQEMAMIPQEEVLTYNDDSLRAIDECEIYIKKHQSMVDDFVAKLSKE